MGFNDFLLVFVLFVVALLTRVYNIAEPTYVCWDETHFGKMAGSYINRTFFFDVHPPLGKLIIAAAGYLTGYDGKYPFTSTGDSYFSDENQLLVPYIHLRVCCAIFGALTVPICFSITSILTNGNLAPTISALFIIFDVGLVTLSRFILLDPILIFFVMFSIYSILKTSSLQGDLSKRSIPNYWHRPNKSFSLKWWFWLIITGVALGCTVSVKFVGVFTVTFVGLWTLFDLWNILGNLQVSILRLLQHFSARVIGLVVVPISVYISIFYIHFSVLTHTGIDVDFYSSTFQSTFKGNPMHNVNIARFVQPNSIVTIKSKSLRSVFLHSHKHLYPEEQLQQVTGYFPRDLNNMWKIGVIPDKGNKSLIHGDHVHLSHSATGKYLSTILTDNGQWHSSLLTKRHLLVSATAEDTFPGSAWKIELQSWNKNEEYSKLCTLNCYFKLYNVEANCYLHFSDKTLPDWGWNQKEITCTDELRNMDNCVWFIERSDSLNNKDTLSSIPEISFMSKFIESHYVMFGLNSQLLPAPGEKTSNPWSWPINFKGQHFSKAEDTFRLTATKVTWYTVIICGMLFILYYGFLNILHARNESLHLQILTFKYQKNSLEIMEDIDNLSGCCWCLLAWGLHYFPFLLMSRITFFHHYFVAHIFGCIFSAIFISTFILKWSKIVHSAMLVVLSSIVIHYFVLNMHLSYGST